jgi:DNA topoisomerase-3
VAEAEVLLSQRTLGPLQGFRSRLGRPFAAILKISDEQKLEFDFGQSRDDDEANAEPVDFSGQPALGPCPKCGSAVHEHGLSYVCEKSVGPERSCDFRSGKIILQQEIAPEQMRKLLDEGRTDLLQGFVSQRTRRKFKAFLVRGADGKIGFEFTPRPGKPAGAEPAAKSAARAKTKADANADAERPAPLADEAAEAGAKAASKTTARTTTKTSAKTSAKTATKTAAKTPAKKAAGTASKRAKPASAGARAGTRAAGTSVPATRRRSGG